MVAKEFQTAFQHAATAEWEHNLHKNIDAVVDQIVAKFAPTRVILFGSHARGDADPDSDVDLLVVMPDDSNPPTSLDIRRAISYDVPLDLLVYTQCDLDARVHAGDFFLQDAVNLGDVLYERSCD